MHTHTPMNGCTWVHPHACTHIHTCAHTPGSRRAGAHPPELWLGHHFAAFGEQSFGGASPRPRGLGLSGCHLGPASRSGFHSSRMGNRRGPSELPGAHRSGSPGAAGAGAGGTEGAWHFRKQSGDSGSRDPAGWPWGAGPGGAPGDKGVPSSVLPGPPPSIRAPVPHLTLQVPSPGPAESPPPPPSASWVIPLHLLSQETLTHSPASASWFPPVARKGCSLL